MASTKLEKYQVSSALLLGQHQGGGDFDNLKL
jgi:hypothetical protein